MVWAAVLSLLLAVLSFLVVDLGWQTVLTALTEVGAVVALFTLVCAAEAWN